jgi:hypothetical protein
VPEADFCRSHGHLLVDARILFLSTLNPDFINVNSRRIADATRRLDGARSTLISMPIAQTPHPISLIRTCLAPDGIELGQIDAALKAAGNTAAK